MVEIISSILEAEKKADGIIEIASEKAKKIKAEGDAQSEKIVSASIGVFKISRSKKLREAEKRAEAEYEKVLARENERTAEFAAAAQNRIEDAVSLIVKKVME